MSGSLDPALQQALFAAQADCAAAARAALAGGQPRWITFAPPGGGPQRFDAEMKDHLNTEGVAGSFGGEASSGDMLIAGMELAQRQYAMLAQMRRDFLLRRRTRLRARAHAVTRLWAFGLVNGPLTGPILEKFKDLLKAGSPP